MGRSGRTVRDGAGDQPASSNTGTPISRGAATKALLVGMMGGLVSRFARVPPAAEGRERQRRTLWAIVAATGAITRGKGTAGNQIHQATGRYIIGFNRDVSQCAYSATTTGGAALPIGVEESSPKSVKVTIVDTDNAPIDSAFHLIVIC